MPVPSADIMVEISSLARIFSRGAFSTLSGLPRSGKIAWKLRSRACFALPPALSPSTMKSSLTAAFLPVQLLSLPTRFEPLSLFCCLAMSFALFAASRERAAPIALATIFSAADLNPRIAINASSLSETRFSTLVRTSGLPSLLLVCPSNCTFCILTVMTATIPSRKSSPSRFCCFSFRMLFLRANSLKTLVTADLNPTSCVPPSGVGMLLT